VILGEKQKVEENWKEKEKKHSNAIAVAVAEGGVAEDAVVAEVGTEFEGRHFGKKKDWIESLKQTKKHLKESSMDMGGVVVGAVGAGDGDGTEMGKDEKHDSDGEERHDWENH